MFKKIIEFLRGVKTEIDKVTWPGKKEIISSTILVIILVFIIAFYVSLVDFVFSRLLTVIVQ